MEEINQLKDRVTRLEAFIASSQDVSKLALELQNALVARGFVRTDGPKTGVIYANGINPASVVAPATDGNVYVANVSAGAVTTLVTFTKGIRTT